MSAANRDLRFWVLLSDLGDVRLPVGMPIWDFTRLDRHPVPIIGHSEAGPLIACRNGDDVVFAVPGASRAICLAEPQRLDGAPMWLDALPWAVAAIVAARGVQARGPDKVSDYAEKMPTARWRSGVFSAGQVQLVSDHRRVTLAGSAVDHHAEGGFVYVAGSVSPSSAANAPWPYGVPTTHAAFHKPSAVWTSDMPADAADVAALRLTIAAALREGVLRRDSAQLVGNGAA
jgi:hypothetical protein